MDMLDLKYHEPLSALTPLKRSYTLRATPTRKKGDGAYDRYLFSNKILNI
jgi:hypothetical protein